MLWRNYLNLPFNTLIWALTSLASTIHNHILCHIVLNYKMKVNYRKPAVSLNQVYPFNLLESSSIYVLMMMVFQVIWESSVMKYHGLEIRWLNCFNYEESIIAFRFACSPHPYMNYTRIDLSDHSKTKAGAYPSSYSETNGWGVWIWDYLWKDLECLHDILLSEVNEIGLIRICVSALVAWLYSNLFVFRN